METISQAVMHQAQLFIEEDTLLQAASRIALSPQRCNRGSIAVSRLLTNSPNATSPYRGNYSKRVSLGLGDSAHIRPSIFDEKLRSEHGSFFNSDIHMKSPTRRERTSFYVVPSNNAVQEKVTFNNCCDDKLGDTQHVKLMKDAFLGSPRKMDPFSSHGNESFKRRLSGMMISTNFFDDQDAPAERRGSMASIDSFASETLVDDDDDDDDESLIMITSPCEPASVRPAPCPAHMALPSHPSNNTPSLNVPPFRAYGRPSNAPVYPAPTQPTIPLVKAKGIMENFTSAMGKSMRTQQAIHDWDKKMGLKRSHSKTMRLSMRSRKKLKTLIRKDINALANLK